MLQQFVDALDPAIEVIRFDVPGTGDSPVPLIPYRFSGLAWLVKKMLDQLGHQQIDVLGVSWCDALAQQFAFQYPIRCRRLILVSTGIRAFMVPGNPAALAKIATPRRYLDPCAGYVAHPFPKKTVFTLDFRRCDPPFPAFLPRSRSLQD